MAALFRALLTDRRHVPEPAEPTRATRLQAAAWIIVAVTLLAHTAIRCALSGNLDLDEAEQLVLVQTFSAGYSVQPPLYTWLLWPFGQVFGPNVVALAVLKLLVLAALYLLMARLARRILGDVGALAAVTPMLLPVITWEAWRMTHTPLLCVLCLTTLLTVLRIRERPSWPGYATLGVCIGLGMLAKYNFAVFAMGLFVACCWLPAYRARVLDRRLGLTVIVAALVLLPHAWWVGQNYADIVGYLQSRTGFADRPFRASALLQGLGAFAAALALALAGPFLSAGLLLGKPSRTDDQRTDGREGYHLALAFAAVTLLLYLGVLVAGGMRTFRGHWFAPLLLVLPFWWLGRYAAASPRRQAVYLGVIALVGLGTVAARGSAFFLDFDHGRFQSRDHLYADLAADVRRHGVNPPFIVATDILSGGYARIYFPDCPVYSFCFLSKPPLAAEWSEALLLWDATTEADASTKVRPNLQRLGWDPASSGEVRYIHTDRKAFDTRTTHLGYCVVRNGRKGWLATK